MIKKQSVIALPVNLGAYTDFVNEIFQLAESKKSSYICVANVHMLIEAFRHSSFSSIMNSADIVTPDGMPLVWALRILHKIKQERVAGMDLLPDILKEAERKETPIFLYGGTLSMLQKTHEHIKAFYKDLPLAGMYSPPFRPLAPEEETEVCNNINESGARIVLVILGCPKQEKWMASMKGKLNAVMIGIGGALPVMIGAQKRAPKWMQSSGLEWLFRLMQEPKRLFKRYAVTNSLFLYLLFREYFRIKLERKIA